MIWISIIVRIDLIVKSERVWFVGSKIEFFVDWYEFVVFVGRELVGRRNILVERMKEVMVVVEMGIRGKWGIWEDGDEEDEEVGELVMVVGVEDVGVEGEEIGVGEVLRGM